MPLNFSILRVAEPPGDIVCVDGNDIIDEEGIFVYREDPGIVPLFI